ncbi:radical SAM protein [Candidatus Sumerlaeota bacterium]|nr:radical SAM protein [Candidatus Sumerlaeota bacterium]
MARQPVRILLLAFFDEWCLGLRTLSAVLKREGHDVRLAIFRGMSEMHDSAGEGDPDGYHHPPASATNADFDALINVVREVKPDLIGMGFCSNFFGLARETTRRMRSATEAPILWGGADPTVNPDLGVQYADAVCVGEGEAALVEIAERIAEKRPFNDVANLCMRDAQGEIIHNARRPLITELDALPWPDFDRQSQIYITSGEARAGALPAVSSLHDSYPLLSGRGCPFSCTYCCNSHLRELYGAKHYVRQRSVDNVIREIEQARKNSPGIRHVEFHDDVFSIDMEWLQEWAGQYTQRIGLPFSCYSHPATTTAERVAILKRAGVSFTIMGVQSGSERILREIYKRNTPRERILEAARQIREAGIHLVIDLISANPFETEEDRRATLDLMLQMPEGFMLHEVNRLCIFRNHPISDQMIAAGFEEQGILELWDEDRNMRGAKDSDEHRFWIALLSLTEFKNELGEINIRQMADDPFLRQHPAIVEGISHAMIDARYLPGSRKRRDTRLHELEAELLRLKGSRIVRYALRLREILSRRTA